MQLVPSFLSENNEPSQKEVEQKDWVHRQLFPIFWHHLFDEVDWVVGAPDEGQCYVDKFDYDMHVASNKEIYDRSHVQWKEAVSQQADWLK